MKKVFEQILSGIWRVLRSVKVRRREHALRLCETLPLGEKRLLAIVQCDGQRLLIGATNDSISLLLRLNNVRKRASQSESAEEVFSTDGFVQ